MDRQEIENLIARVALKDRAAFDQLYDRVSAKLFGVCLRVLNKRAAAEDAMQDSFVKIWNNADKYNANGLSPMTWLITIARNTSIDRLRARKKGHQDVNTPGFELVSPVPRPNNTPLPRQRRRACRAVLIRWKKTVAKPFGVPIWMARPIPIWLNASACR